MNNFLEKFKKEWKFLLFLPYKKILFSIILLKLILASVFSSDYLDVLFIPFIKTFLHDSLNPWQYIFENSWPVNLPSPFPYPPAMLYILAGPYALATSLTDSTIILALAMKLPTLIADLFIFLLLVRLFPMHTLRIIIFYFLSPIVLYAAYMHGQLDLIPTAFLFWSLVLLIRKQTILSALVYGITLAIKFHTIIAFPLIFVYLYRNKRIKDMFWMIGLSILVFVVLIAPFIGSEGFIKYVFANEQQAKLKQVYFAIGSFKIILPLFVSTILYARFLIYSKINRDLLFGFMGALFSVFVLLVPPAPAWYIWMLPYLAVFFIQRSTGDRLLSLSSLYIALTLIYIVYFVFFYIPEIPDLSFMGEYILLKLDDEYLHNLVFTGLAVALCAVIFVQYRFGIRSNLIYRRDGALVIGIAGDSSTGKTTLLADLKILFGKENMLELEGDGEHKWERGDKNYKYYSHLHPKANFLYRQADNVLTLKRGHSIRRSEYNHETGTFKNPVLLKSRDFIVLCGLHSFFLPRLRQIVDLKIYMEPEDNLRQEWKINRDMKERGYTRSQVIDQIKLRHKDAMNFIHPQRNHADLIVSHFKDEETNRINLRITFDVNIDVEGILQSLNFQGFQLFHDYEENFKYQYLILDEDISSIVWSKIASKHIANLDEILGIKEVSWQENSRGFVQLIVLFMISNLMKGQVEDVNAGITFRS